MFEPLSTEISSTQVPQLEGDSTKLLLSGTAVDGEQYLVVQAVDGKKVTLPVGFVQGESEGSRYALYRESMSVRDPRNKLGEARVIDVGTSTCVAELEGPEAERIKPEELKTARAVVLRRAFGANPLFVLFEGVERPEEELKQYAFISSVDKEGRPVTKDTYHVRVRPAGTIDSGTGKEILVDPKTDKEVLATNAVDPVTGKGVFIDLASGEKVTVAADPRPKLREGFIWVQDRNGDVLAGFPDDDQAAMMIPEVLFDEWKGATWPIT